MGKYLFRTILLLLLCSLSLIKCEPSFMNHKALSQHKTIAAKITQMKKHLEKTPEKKKEDAAAIKKEEGNLLLLEEKAKKYCEKKNKQSQEKNSLCLLKLKNLPLTYTPADASNELGKLETSLINARKTINLKVTNEISKCLRDKQEEQNKKILDVCVKDEYKDLTDNEKLEQISEIQQRSYASKCTQTVEKKTLYNKCLKALKKAQLEADEEKKAEYTKSLDTLNSQTGLSLQEYLDVVIKSDNIYNKEYNSRKDDQNSILTNCLEGNAE